MLENPAIDAFVRNGGLDEAQSIGRCEVCGREIYFFDYYENHDGDLICMSCSMPEEEEDAEFV